MAGGRAFGGLWAAAGGRRRFTAGGWWRRPMELSVSGWVGLGDWGCWGRGLHYQWS
jgi:hypothetical protein